MAKTPDMTAFREAYTRLNQAQKEAVDTIEGPVMVIAGPGTGKTQVLTLRIANILLKTQMQPENILALTFTDSGAKAMRERLRQYIGSAAYRVPIFTFHGFAQRLISEYPDAFPRIIGGRAATDIEKVDLIELILETPELKLLRPLGDPHYYVPQLLRMISTLKQEYVSPDNLAVIIEQQLVTLNGIEKIHQKGAHKGKVRGEYSEFEKSITKNQELLFVYRRYEQLLQDKRLYDFDDMIIETVHALTTSTDLLADLQETYQYVLADEHQDVNGAQNKILETLCNFHDSPNIFVVGDEKQAIYRFQGATLDNFLYFVDLFPTTKQIVLTENYRSGQVILNTAQGLMETSDETLQAMRVPLRAALVTEALVTRRDFSHQAVEDDWFVAAIKERLAHGLPPSEIAVIVRTNREVESIAARLRQAQIPVKASADGDVLDHAVTQAVQALIDFVLLDSNEEALFKVLHGAYWGLSTSDIIKITSARTFERSLSGVLTDPELLSALNVEKQAAALNIMAVQQTAREKEVYEAPHRVLQYLLEASGFLDHVMKHDPYEGVRVIRRLYDELEAMVIRDGVSTLREVSEILALRRRYGLPLQAPYIATVTDAVEVMTAHKSKGLEFAVVFLPHLQDTAWGGGRAKRQTFSVPLSRYHLASGDVLDDERRLLYVAGTRAKRELHLSVSAQTIQGKEVLSSRLLEELGAEDITVVDVSALEQNFNPAGALKETVKGPEITTHILSKYLTERGFSATSLNNYLQNPWDFVYRNVLRIPEVQALPMQFGTIVHTVLQHVTAWHTEKNSWPSDFEIKSWLEAQLRKLPVSKLEYTKLHERGMEIIFSYLSHLEKTLHAKTREEMSIRVAFATGLEQIPEIPLTGKLDRIDLSGTGEALRVVDYKTGKPKTRGEIEGTTASSTGAYKRQLVFYALLLSLYDDERYRDCRTGALSFVEPLKNGEIREEVFTITEEEIAALAQEIKDAIANLITGEFMKNEQWKSESSYAHLVKQLYSSE